MRRTVEKDIPKQPALPTLVVHRSGQVDDVCLSRGAVRLQGDTSTERSYIGQSEAFAAVRTACEMRLREVDCEEGVERRALGNSAFRVVGDQSLSKSKGEKREESRKVRKGMHR
jgi:hypothetical protein